MNNKLIIGGLNGKEDLAATLGQGKLQVRLIKGAKVLYGLINKETR